MTNQTSRIGNVTRISNAVTETGQQDAKGRAIGYMTDICQYEMIAATGDAGWGYHQAPGTYFVAKVQMTRNGKVYGASQPQRWFADKAEAEAHCAALVAKRIK